MFKYNTSGVPRLRGQARSRNSSEDGMNKHKHLEFIQAVIGRLSEHSFRLKTFSLLQVGAIAAFVASRDEPVGVLCLLAPAAAFVLWYLDARFLRDERAYRSLYERVRLMEENRVDFSMSTERGKLLAAVRSPSLSLFYITLAASSLFVVLGGFPAGAPEPGAGG